MTYYDEWILEDQLMMGAHIPSEELYRHLIEEDGITHILDLERACDLRHDDPAKESAQILHLYFPDDGMQRPDWFWLSGFEFALETIQDGGTVLVHCRRGASRGPSMVYGILRHIEELPEERTSQVNGFDFDPEEKVAPRRREVVYKDQIEDFLERHCSSEPGE